jgi:hypothetical protein
VQCNFKDAEEVHRMTEEDTRLEEAEGHRTMQIGYDGTLKKVLPRLKDARAAVRVQEFLQDRAILGNIGRPLLRPLSSRRKNSEKEKRAKHDDGDEIKGWNLFVTSIV